MKIILLGGDGPESEDELSMYSYNTKRVSKAPKVYTTVQPINPAKNFDDWMKHIHSESQSLSREWRSHYNVL